MTVLLVSFADGGDEWKSALRRLENQALTTGMFSSVACFTVDDYIAHRPSFAKDLEHILQLDSGHLAYRAVKAWLIRDALRGDFGEFDLIVYLDAGCELNLNGIASKRMGHKLKSAYNKGGLAELLAEMESSRTKPAVLRHLNLSSEESQTRQVQATWSMWRVCEANLELAQRWVDLSDPDLNLWQNPKTPNGSEEHRRDQSLMSILWKRLGLPTQEVECHFDTSTRIGKLRLSVIPILTIRNRSGQSTALRARTSFAKQLLGLAVHLAGLNYLRVANLKRFK